MAARLVAGNGGSEDKRASWWRLASLLEASCGLEISGEDGGGEMAAGESGGGASARISLEDSFARGDRGNAEASASVRAIR